MRKRLPNAPRLGRSVALNQRVFLAVITPEKFEKLVEKMYGMAMEGDKAVMKLLLQYVIGKPPGWGKKASEDYREHRYHQPSDNFDPNWDWSEGQQIGQLGFWLGWDAANAATMPNWVPGDEFRAVRDKSMK